MSSARKHGAVGVAVVVVLVIAYLLWRTKESDASPRDVADQALIDAAEAAGNYDEAKALREARADDNAWTPDETLMLVIVSIALCIVGALAGYAVGGPWGAAIGAVIGFALGSVLTVIVNEWQEEVARSAAESAILTPDRTGEWGLEGGN